MTKKELILALEELPDEALVLVVDQTGTLVPCEVERHEGGSGTFADGFIVIVETED